MAKELIISSNRHETKVAMFEDEQLVEIYFQRSDEYSLAGSIHKGRVTRVLPGMQSAFVNIGLERDAFLYVSDFFEESEEEYEKTPVPASRGPKKSRGPQLVDEDTGEPTNESNERFAAAQTVAELSMSDDIDLVESDTEQNADVEPAVEASDRAGSPEERRSDPRAASSFEADGSPDDRRGKRRRRKRSRGGSTLPESKFADSGRGRPEARGESRPGRTGGRSGDDDSRWNRKPTEPNTSQVGFDDEDPPQAVLIAKVSDPNRLPPPRRHDDTPLVLPGESLAKYRRGGEPRKDSQDFTDSTEMAGGRYSQPRRSRHGRAGFLAPADDGEKAGNTEEHPAEGSSASLFPPDDSNPQLAVKLTDDNDAAEAGDGSAASDESAGSTAKTTTKRKSTAKKAAKATKTTAKKATRKRATKAAAKKGKADSDAGQESGEEVDAVANPGADEDAVASEQAENVSKATNAPVADMQSESDEQGSAWASADAPSSDQPMTSATTEDSAAEDDAEVREDGEEAEGGQQTGDGDGDGPQRLSRRERRRLRMVERRDERRKSRDSKSADGDAPAAEEVAADSESAPAEVVPAGRPGRPEPQVRRERLESARSERAEGPRGERTESARGDRSETARSDRSETARTERPDRSRGSRTAQPAQSIAEVLKEGQEVLVQIAKEPLGQKGARITSHIALPGRYVVYMPTVEHIGVSRKVGTDNERIRLRKILQSVREGMQGGFICRTAAEGRTEAEIRADMEFLHNMWLGIKDKADKKKAPSLIHHDLDIVERMLRDQLTDEFKTIWVDNEELYERILRFVQTVQPSLVSRVRLYTKPAPIFDTFSVTSELDKALRPKVWLKSGGYIVINQTEALVAIDVNTGKFVGKSNRLEDTIVKTNLEAVKEAVRQIRLRDLGGIIVVDFIDMDERKNRYRVMQALDEAMKVDRAPYKILQFNDFGLIAITRKRVKQSLERTLCQPCPTCEGAGYIKNVQTIIGEILTEAQKLARAIDDPEVSLRVHPEVGKVLKSHTNRYLEELEEILKVPVIVTSDPLLHPEKFDLA